MTRPADVDLTTVLADAHLDNPVMTASGCAGTGRELQQFFEVRELGAIVTRSVTRDARSGPPPPRVSETSSGVLSTTAMQGPGVDSFLARDLPWLLHHDARPIVSIAGSTLGEYAELARRVGNTPGVAGIEVNLVAPSADDRGRVFAQDPFQAARVSSVVRREAPRGLSVFVKLSPDVTSVVEVAEAVLEAGADGLVLINSPLGLAIDPVQLRPRLAAVTGGVSGPAIKPLALRAVWQVARTFPDVPIVGVGGIRTGTDALEFLAAGASAVQVGTATFADPLTPRKVLDELRTELARCGFTRVGQAVGAAQRAVGHTRRPPSSARSATEKG